MIKTKLRKKPDLATVAWVKQKFKVERINSESDSTAKENKRGQKPKKNKSLSAQLRLYLKKK